MTIFGYSLVALFFFTLLRNALVRPSRHLLTVLTFAPLRRIGVISYFIYLFHYPFLGLTHYIFRDQVPSLEGGVMATLAALGFTVFAAEISWRIFERPLIAIGHRYKY